MLPDVHGDSDSNPVIHISVNIIKKGKSIPFEGDDDDANIPFDTCADGHKNGEEPTADCGGQCDKKCGVAQKCKKKADCAGGLPCAGGICGAFTCQQWYAAGQTDPGFFDIVVNADNGATETVYCADGYQGGVGSDGEAKGWYQIDTCMQSWNAGPNKAKCATQLAKPSARAHQKVLAWYKKNIDYPAADNFHKQGQFGAFQRWIVPRDTTVEFKLWGASGTICMWWPNQQSRIGRGGLTYGSVKVKKGDEFWFIVGQKGRPGTEKNGGWGGGGQSWTTNGPGGSSGSGGTHVFWRKSGAGQPPYPTNDGNDFRILVAGGAGAASTEACTTGDDEDRHGGNGGGFNGERGGWGNECGGGFGGSQSGPGEKGCNEGYAGDRFRGGRGAENDAGGGGGGYFGGGGGGYNSGGGGGSAYIGNHHLDCAGCPEPSASGSEAGVTEFPKRRENQKNDQSDFSWDLTGEGRVWFRFK